MSESTIELSVFIGSYSNECVGLTVSSNTTIGEIVAFLTENGFLEKANIPLVFYEKDGSHSVNCDNFDKTISECNWHNGQEVFVAYAALYGCPTANGVSGLVPECMLISCSTLIYSNWK